MSNKHIGTLHFVDEVGVVPEGKTWISFLNKGDVDATIKSFDDGNHLKGIIPLVTVFNVGEDREHKEWGKFEVDATGTEVYISFLD